MAKGYSKLEAKRLAQQASTQLAMSRMAMMKAIIPDNRGWHLQQMYGIIKETKERNKMNNQLKQSEFTNWSTAARLLHKRIVLSG